MSKRKDLLQFILGFLIIFPLWCMSAACNKAHDTYFLYDFSSIFCYIPVIIVAIIPIILILLSIICKRTATEYLYLGAFLATFLPPFASFISDFFTDDGNILTWIFAYTIGLVLIPFGRLFWETYQGISNYYFIFKEEMFIEESTIIFRLFFVIVISLILFFAIKTKKAKTKNQSQSVL